MARVLPTDGSVKHAMPLQTCIVDFAVSEDDAIVIEVNPLDVYSGPLLFDWCSDADVICDGIAGESDRVERVISRVVTKERHRGIVLASFEDIVIEIKSKWKELEVTGTHAQPCAVS